MLRLIATRVFVTRKIVSVFGFCESNLHEKLSSNLKQVETIFSRLSAVSMDRRISETDW